MEGTGFEYSIICRFEQLFKLLPRQLSPPVGEVSTLVWFGSINPNTKHLLLLKIFKERINLVFGNKLISVLVSTDV